MAPHTILYEAYKKHNREKGEDVALEAYAQIMRIQVIPLDQDAARTPTSTSNTLAMADAIIYSTAKTYSAELVTSDPHLKGLEGTKFIE